MAWIGNRTFLDLCDLKRTGLSTKALQLINLYGDSVWLLSERGIYTATTQYGGAARVMFSPRDKIERVRYVEINSVAVIDLRSSAGCSVAQLLFTLGASDQAISALEKIKAYVYKSQEFPGYATESGASTPPSFCVKNP